MSTAREAILGRIRRALDTAGARRDKTTVSSPKQDPSSASTRSNLATFEAMLDKVQATHERCADHRTARAAIDRLCTSHKLRSLAVSDCPLARELTAETAILCHRDADRATLLRTDAGVSSAQLAICETGTLVLDHDSEAHRELSLLPPLHIAIVRSRDFVPSLEHALARLEQRGESPPRAVTFITGASRTADIELTLIIGVHGPKALHVLILQD